jgi:hypothetical protein
MLSLRRLGAGGAAIAALALSGCAPGILTQAYQQNDEIGTAQINQTLCAALDSSQTPPACAFYYNQALFPTQYLLAYQVRNDVTAPATITSANERLAPRTSATSDAVKAATRGIAQPDAPTQKVNYTQSSSYSSELERLYPAPAGQHWVGYISDVQRPEYAIGAATITASGDVPADEWDVSPQFGLQQPADGPFTGPFAHASVVGYRNLPITAPVIPLDARGSTPAVTADSDVVCHDPSQQPPTADVITPLVQSGDVAGLDRLVLADPGIDTANAYCDTGDDQAPDPSLTRVATTGNDTSARYAGFKFVATPDPTRDLWLGGSSNAVIAQGASGTVNFTAKFAGAAGPQFPLTATSDLAGAGVTPPASLVPGADSTTGVPVGVTVPANAAVGPHTVQLTANGINGQRRTATATYNVALRVVVPSLSAAAHVTIRHRFLVRLVKGAKERVRLSCPANSAGCAGTLMFKTVFGGSNTLAYTLKAGQSKTYVLTPSKALVRYLKRHKKTALATAIVYVTNGGDATTTQTTDTRTIHISPRPAK